mmetsp:Transcript_31334/g.66691  ORF Transcript_31334/g.66691 Transcript_31334/m.66691 type:complete len:116 (+) Transcript_31334:220-567(+)
MQDLILVHQERRPIWMDMLGLEFIQHERFFWDSIPPPSWDSSSSPNKNCIDCSALVVHTDDSLRHNPCNSLPRTSRKNPPRMPCNGNNIHSHTPHKKLLFRDILHNNFSCTVGKN